MAIPRIGGAGIGLNLNNAMGSAQALGAQILPSTGFQQGVGSNVFQLPAGQVINIPAGTYAAAPGPFTSLQFLDPVLAFWRTINAENSIRPIFLESDGGNFRFANLTGCPIGAIITTSGSGYTNGIGTTATGLTITPSAGGSVWVPVVGGVLQLAASAGATPPITAGSNYLFPPLVVIDPPPAGGIQATGHLVMSGGGIQSGTGFVFDNQGAGYTTVPKVTLINDPRDNTGSGGAVAISSTFLASGSLAAMYPSGALGTASGVGGYGLPQNSVITFTFSPASTTAATAIMNFTVTGITMTASGAGFQSGSAALLLSNTPLVAGTRSSASSIINDVNLTMPRMAQISLAAQASSGSFTSAGAVITDPGFGLQAVPNLVVIPGGTSVITTAAAFTATVGGTTDYCYLQPI